MARASGFSALTICSRTRRLIVYNPRRPPARRANSVVHEVSHVVLEHPTAPALGDGGKPAHMIELRCKVTKAEDGYHYSYRFKNTSPSRTAMFSWDVIDKALTGGMSIGTMWELKPGEEKAVTMVDPRPPLKARGDARSWRVPASTKSWTEEYLKDAIVIPPGDFWNAMTMTATGPLPDYSIKKAK
jgi:hypothetical protein